MEGKQGSGTGRTLLNYRSFFKDMRVTEVLECLKKYGQRLDLEIAKEMGMPLATVRQRLTGLAATGRVTRCNLTRFEGGRGIDAWQARAWGLVPPRAPGRSTRRTRQAAAGHPLRAT